MHTLTERIEPILEALHNIGAQHHWIDSGPRRHRSDPVEGLPTTEAGLTALTEDYTAQLADLADTSALRPAAAADFRAELEGAVTDLIADTADGIRHSLDAAYADARGVIRPPDHPAHLAILRALDGVHNAAGDIGILVSYPGAAAILADLHAFEEAMLTPGTEPDIIAAAAAAYRTALPIGVPHCPDWMRYTACLHYYASLPLAAGHADRAERYRQVIAARTTVVAWWAATTADPDCYRYQ